MPGPCPRLSKHNDRRLFTGPPESCDSYLSREVSTITTSTCHSAQLGTCKHSQHTPRYSMGVVPLYGRTPQIENRKQTPCRCWRSRFLLLCPRNEMLVTTVHIKRPGDVLPPISGPLLRRPEVRTHRRPKEISRMTASEPVEKMP